MAVSPHLVGVGICVSYLLGGPILSHHWFLNTLARRPPFLSLLFSSKHSLEIAKVSSLVAMLHGGGPPGSYSIFKTSLPLTKRGDAVSSRRHHRVGGHAIRLNTRPRKQYVIDWYVCVGSACNRCINVL